MQCPFCSGTETKVVDSRSTQDPAIRRRRECLGCGRRFTTYEKVEEAPLKVVKKDGTKQPYDRRKIETGLAIACSKRPIKPEQIADAVRRIENDLYDSFEREVPSEIVGKMVEEVLKELDPVAHLRFASVLHEFQNVEDFANAQHE